MIYETTNLPEHIRHRILDNSNRSVVILEDHGRLSEDATGSSSFGRRCQFDNGSVESSHSQFTSSLFPPPVFQSHHFSPSGIRPMPMLRAPVDRFSLQYPPLSAFVKHPSLVPQPQPQEEKNAESPPKIPILTESRSTMNENRNEEKNSNCCYITKLPQQSRKLPPNFRLSPNTVVLGKGKGPKEASGNMRLQELVRESLDEYIDSGRHGKMLVISKVIGQIQSESNACNGHATPVFVRFQNNFWWEVTEKECRVKLSATFRDLLSDKYRSSSKSKVEYRRQQRQHQRDVSDFVDAVRALKTLNA
jgi:hypothetical protein